MHIADTADDFITAAEFELNRKDRSVWLEKVDLFLSQNSWDKTWGKMMELINQTLKIKQTEITNNIVNKLNNKENVYV